ncbi:class I SAM-dependent methyltransferase [Melioribacter sp. OK-6-Me]|uniref:class I SAM-dependent methyltransferase n=1 Tax=unclassified Melioribacter TaxID=2627329 RepID=UPI003ED9380C
MKNWFKDWFSSEEYFNVYNHRDLNDARLLCNLILRETQLKEDALILDAACGFGRHALFFASKGYNVIGFDLSKLFLDKARSQAVKSGLNLKLVCTDIRYVCFKVRFDLILNLFTSFGYFESDEENFSFIERSYKFLNNDGWYVFDYLNKTYLEKNLEAETIRKINGLVITEKRSIRNKRVIKKIEINNGNKIKTFYESVKLYSSHTLIKKFEQFGYKLVNLYGDYNGSSYSDNSPRLIMFFKK